MDDVVVLPKFSSNTILVGEQHCQDPTPIYIRCVSDIYQHNQFDLPGMVQTACAAQVQGSDPAIPGRYTNRHCHSSPQIDRDTSQGPL